MGSHSPICRCGCFDLLCVSTRSIGSKQSVYRLYFQDIDRMGLFGLRRTARLLPFVALGHCGSLALQRFAGFLIALFGCGDFLRIARLLFQPSQTQKLVHFQYPIVDFLGFVAVVWFVEKSTDSPLFFVGNAALKKEPTLY